MSDIVGFLEALGSAPRTRSGLPAAQLEAAAHGVSEEHVVRAMQGQGGSELARLLGGRAAMRCFIVASE